MTYVCKGVRVIFADGSRIIFRLSGTGSSGATIRMYVEKYTSTEKDYDLEPSVALKEVIEVALELSKLVELTGRKTPTVM
jgi:phosphoglucomutase